MEKTGDFTLSMDRPALSVTPSAPPSYDEAVGGNLAVTNTGVPYTSPVASDVHLQVAPQHYPVQDARGAVSIQPQRPVIVGMLPVGPKSLKTTCPSCQKSIRTRTNTKNRLIKYFCCILLLGSIVCSLCSCLPFCMCPSTKVEHFCPSCNAYLGTFVVE